MTGIRQQLLNVVAIAAALISFQPSTAAFSQELRPLAEHEFVVQDKVFKVEAGSYGKFSATDGSEEIDLTRVFHEKMKKEKRYINITTGETYNPQDGRRSGKVTIYSINPPLLPIGYGVNWDSPAALVQSTFNQGLTPVFSPSGEKVPNHAIGHIAVRIQVPGLPEVLTGMTTGTDSELFEDLIRQQDGLAILFESQVGRFNTAAELMTEFQQRSENQLLIKDGRDAQSEHFIDGNYSFVSFELNELKARGVYAFLLEYIHRGIQNNYGSLTSRPSHASGAGCIAFGISFLKAAGVIPVVSEQDLAQTINQAVARNNGKTPFWAKWVRELYVPPSITGKIQIEQSKEAGIGILDLEKVFGDSFDEDSRATIFDLLFDSASEKDLAEGSKALTKAALGGVAAMVGWKDFQGFTIPSWIRSPVKWLITSDDSRAKTSWVDRNSPDVKRALPLIFWDNALLDLWIKETIAAIESPASGQDPVFGITVETEGKGIKGINFDAREYIGPNPDLFSTIDAVETVIEDCDPRMERTRCPQ